VCFFTAKDIRNDFLCYLTLEDHPEKFLRGQQAEEYYYKLICSLLNDRTAELYLKSINSWQESNYHKIDLLQKIPTRAPNLKKITLVYGYEKKFPSPFSRVEEPMLNLHTLDVSEWLWSDRDLDLMTNVLPNLEKLEV
jgi:hypothetical protein